MFEFTPLHFSIGRGWFSNQQGFCLEFDLLTVGIVLHKQSFHGSLFSIYIDIWRENKSFEKEISGDLFYLYQFFKKKLKKVDRL